MATKSLTSILKNKRVTTERSESDEIIDNYLRGHYEYDPDNDITSTDNLNDGEYVEGIFSDSWDSGIHK